MLFEPTAPIVVCSPHFDDAALDCWTVLTQPGGCEVINVFAGVPGDGYSTWWDQLAGARSSAQMYRDRLKEDHAALALAGCTPRIVDFLDGQYRLRASRFLHALLVRVPKMRWRVQSIPILRSWALISPPPTTSEIIAAMTVHVPAASLVCAPAAIGRHPDHVLLRDAALELARSGMPVRLYVDLPYGLRYGWPSWVSGATPINDDAVNSLWRHDLDGAIESLQSAVVEALTPQQRIAKRAAVNCYQSQLSIEGSGFQELLQRDDGFDYEVHWPVPTGRIS